MPKRLASLKVRSCVGISVGWIPIIEGVMVNIKPNKCLAMTNIWRIVFAEQMVNFINSNILNITTNKH